MRIGQARRQQDNPSNEYESRNGGIMVTEAFLECQQQKSPTFNIKIDLPRVRPPVPLDLPRVRPCE